MRPVAYRESPPTRYTRVGGCYVRHEITLVPALGLPGDVLTRVCLISAAVLLWYAVASGMVGLYFYVLLLSEWGGDALGKSFRGGAYEEAIADALLTSTLLASFLLGGLLLFAMPCGLLWAVLKYPPGGLAGAVVRVGCLAAMAMASLCASLLLFGLVTDLLQGGAGGLWWTGWVHVAVLLAGLAATWRSLRWMNRSRVVSGRGG